MWPVSLAYLNPRQHADNKRVSGLTAVDKRQLISLAGPHRGARASIYASGTAKGAQSPFHMLNFTQRVFRCDT